MGSEGRVYAMPEAVMKSKRVRSSEKLVYLAVCGGDAIPPLSEIAERIGAPPDRIADSLHRLRMAGLVEEKATGLAVADVPGEFYDEAGMPRPGSKKKRYVPNRVNASTVEAWFQAAMVEAGRADSFTSWGGKERGLAGRLLRAHGAPLTRAAVEAFVAERRGVPTMVGLWMEREHWIGLARQRVLNRPRYVASPASKPRAVDDEFQADRAAEDPEVGWGG